MGNDVGVRDKKQNNRQHPEHNMGRPSFYRGTKEFWNNNDEDLCER